jgi:hypothetical protein
MNMTNEYEMIAEEVDREWQPGPTVEIDWWGGKHSDLDCSDEECDCDTEEEVAELGLD